MLNNNRKGIVAAMVGILVASTTILGISAQQAQAASDVSIARAMNTPTTLTFWSWLGGQDKQVKMFMTKYPKITVKLLNVGAGGAQYNKLKAGLAAKSGLPDVAQVEFQYIPTFKQLGALSDISKYVPANWLKQFPTWISDQVVDSKGGIYAVPQDSGPMGMIFRSDILAKNNIEVPTTWAEFATAAAALQKADKSVYLSDMIMDSGNMNGLYWQAGARPFKMNSATSINIKLNDAVTKKVSKFWGDLVAAGDLPLDPYWTTDWNAGYNKGKYASHIGAAWGMGVITGSAADTSGKWRVAPLPQWKAGDKISGNWGGSTVAVMSTSKNQIAAAKFADWINTDPDAAYALTQAPTFDFPVISRVLTSKSWLSTAPAFFGGQKVMTEFAAYNKTVGTAYEWSPFQDQVYTLWTNNVLNAITKKQDTAAAVDKWQADVVAYAKDQGYTVTTN